MVDNQTRNNLIVLIFGVALVVFAILILSQFSSSILYTSEYATNTVNTTSVILVGKFDNLSKIMDDFRNQTSIDLKNLGSTVTNETKTQTDALQSMVDKARNQTEKQNNISLTNQKIIEERNKLQDITNDKLDKLISLLSNGTIK